MRWILLNATNTLKSNVASLCITKFAIHSLTAIFNFTFNLNFFKLQGNFIFDGTMLFNCKQLVAIDEDRAHVVKNKVSDIGRSVAPGKS